MYTFLNKNSDSMSGEEVNKLLEEYQLMNKELILVNEKLKNKQEILEAFLNNSPYVAIFIKDEKFRILNANIYFCKLFNRTLSDIIDKNNLDLFIDENEVNRIDESDKLVLKGEIVELEVNPPGKKCKGHKFPIQINDRILIGGYAIEIK